MGTPRYVLPVERRQKISQSCKQAWLANPQRREQQRERCKVAYLPSEQAVSSLLREVSLQCGIVIILYRHYSPELAAISVL